MLARTRAYIRDGYRLIAEWVQQAPDLLTVVPPAATALAFVQYHTDEESTHLAERIRQEASVLVAPGSAFGIEGHLRLTHGLDPAALVPALEGISRVLAGQPTALHVGTGSRAGEERTA